MTKIIRQLLDFALAGTPTEGAVDLQLVARQTLDLLAALAQKHQVAVRLADASEPAVVKADAGQIQQVLTNIIVNAIQAMPHGGSLDIRIHRHRARSPEAPDGDLADSSHRCPRSGRGDSKREFAARFRAFFHDQGRRGGDSDLGLSIAYEIVREHGGWMDEASEPGHGSCFSIYLPTVTT